MPVTLSLMNLRLSCAMPVMGTAQASNKTICKLGLSHLWCRAKHLFDRAVMYRKSDLAEIVNVWDQIKDEERNPKSWKLLAEVLVEAGDEEGATSTHKAFLDVLGLQVEELPFEISLRELTVDFSISAYGKSDPKTIHAKDELDRVAKHLSDLAQKKDFKPTDFHVYREGQAQFSRSKRNFFLYYALISFTLTSYSYGGIFVPFFISLCLGLLLVNFYGPSEAPIEKCRVAALVKYHEILELNSEELQEIMAAKSNLPFRRYLDEDTLLSSMPPFLTYTPT